MTLKLNASDARRMGLAPKRAKHATKGNKAAQQAFIAACKAHGLPEPVPEYKFAAPERKWAWDWCWLWDKDPFLMGLALEIDGGIWNQGKHGRGSGIIKDHEKRNEGVLRGWRVLLATPQDVESGKVFNLLKRALG